MSNSPQRNLSGGEISPALYARTDQGRYATSFRTLRNFICMRTGGVSNRPGFQYLHEIKDSTQAARLLKFVFENGSTSNTYVLEFGNQTIRFTQNGGQVITSGVGAWVTATAYTVGDLVTQGGVTYYCKLAHTSGASTQPGIGATWQTDWYAQTGTTYEIPSPYLATDLPSIQFVQSKDVVTLVHPSYPPQELKRYAHTRWTLSPIAFGPAIGTPTTPNISGGGAGPSNYWWAITAIGATTNEESLPLITAQTTHVPATATPVTISWAAVPGAGSYKVYRSIDGVTFGFIGSTGGTPLAASDTSWGTPTETFTTSTSGSWVADSSFANNQVLTVATDKAPDGNYKIYATMTVTASSLGGTPTFTLGRLRCYYKRDSETPVDAGIVVGPIGVSGVGSAGPIAFSATINVPDNGYTTLEFHLVPEVNGTGTGLNSYQCTADASSAPNNRIDWNKGGASFSDANGSANFTEGPPIQASVFAMAGSYPAAVGYYQQRQIFANIGNDPERMWLSRSASFKSFTTSQPLQSDDSITFRMASTHLNAIKYVMDLFGRCVVFTAESEWTLEGDQAGTLLPTAINPRRQSGAGSGSLPPLLAVNYPIFLQARGTIVRDFRKAITDWDNSDLTLYASHLFDGYTLKDWDYQQTPHSVIWAVRSDGVLLGLTYVPGQDVSGWHRHDTDGVVENVCVVPEGNEDKVYIIVRRTINGVAKRYVERLDSRSITALTDVRDLHFLDAYLTYDGRNTTVETMQLTGGTAWNETETLTLTRSVGGFTAGSVGGAVYFTDATGTQLRVNITGYTSSTVVSGNAVRSVPVELRSTATAVWSLAVTSVSGLSHLEGKKVSVYGDGFVVASPNNAAYPVITVTSGVVTLPAAYAVIHVGLPYLSDIETLDIDTPQGSSLKEHKININRVGVFLEKSRGLWSGRRAPEEDPLTDGTPLFRLQETKLRNLEGYNDPTSMITDYTEITIETNWDSNGRVFLRQVDPVPASILSVTPIGRIG